MLVVEKRLYIERVNGNMFDLKPSFGKLWRLEELTVKLSELDHAIFWCKPAREFQPSILLYKHNAECQVFFRGYLSNIVVV